MIINSLETLISIYDSELNPAGLGRLIYKVTACGPWMSFVTNESVIYYEDAEAYSTGWINNCTGIKIGSIVEGSDSCATINELTFPFTEKDFDLALKNVNEEASFYFERDNGIWLKIFDGEDVYFCQSIFGENKWDERATELIKEIVHNWLESEDSLNISIDPLNPTVVGDIEIIEYYPDSEY